MSSWRLLELEYPDAPSNLALEEALAKQIGQGRSPRTLRLWRNHRAAVIGENQSARLELQLDACQELGVEVVRRFTGGGAVYHDLGNINYSICVPKQPSAALGSQQALFTRALDCAATCLRMLGLDSTQVPINTILVRGRKVSGGAGAIRWGSVFYHGSILVSTDLQTVWKILRREQPPQAPGLVQSTRLPVTSLERELCSEIPIHLVKNTLKNAFGKTYDAELIPGQPTEEELQIANGLAKEKYGCYEWNLKI